MKTKFLIIGLAVLALAGGYTVRATREAGQSLATIDALASERAGLRSATARMEQRLRTASQALALLEQKTGQPSGKPGASPDAADSGNETAARPATPTRRLSPSTIIANDPQKLTEYLQSYRTSLDLTYAGMWKALGFSAEQIEKMKDLWVGVMQREMDLGAAAEMHGLDRNTAAYKELQAELTKIRVTKEAELLGDLEAPYREYRRTLSVRYFAQDLAGAAVYSGEPMTCGQVERTAQVLAAYSQRPQTGQSQGFVDRFTINWVAARAQLQDVLSPTQIAILGSIVQSNTLLAQRDKLRERLTADFKRQSPPK